jgi:hypothetical protein
MTNFRGIPEECAARENGELNAITPQAIIGRRTHPFATEGPR